MNDIPKIETTIEAMAYIRSIESILDEHTTVVGATIPQKTSEVRMMILGGTLYQRTMRALAAKL